jgi:hypothetical protein
MNEVEIPQPQIREILKQHALDEKTYGFRHAYEVERALRLLHWI